jgi:hypothetical protein
MKNVITAAATLALVMGMSASVLAQTAMPPVTMQPIANPPEKAPKTHHAKGGHHKAATAKSTAESK